MLTSAGSNLVTLSNSMEEYLWGQTVCVVPRHIAAALARHVCNFLTILNIFTLVKLCSFQFQLDNFTDLKWRDMYGDYALCLVKTMVIRGVCNRATCLRLVFSSVLLPSVTTPYCTRWQFISGILLLGILHINRRRMSGEGGTVFGVYCH